MQFNAIRLMNVIVHIAVAVPALNEPIFLNQKSITSRDMSRWQTICTIVAILLAGLFFGHIAIKDQQRGFINVASRSIGHDLITTTNSSHLVGVGPELRIRLSELLASRTGIADVLPGDEPPPFGDGTACSRLVLTNNSGEGLLIRLRPTKDSDFFRMIGFRRISERL
jgi:hypothetical protein